MDNVSPTCGPEDRGQGCADERPAVYPCRYISNPNLAEIGSACKQFLGHSLKWGTHGQRCLFVRTCKENEYRQIFGCEVGALPIRYLGIPVHHRKLRNSEWNPVESRFGAKLGCWRSKLLSYGDRLVLINSVLTSLPMFMLSFQEIPVGVRKRLDFYRSSFFWKTDNTKKKYRLTKWNMV
jgi:hypothetical protein